MTVPMIEAEGLGKNFDGFLAVDDGSLKVHSGEGVALLGPNGAAKRTTLRLLASLLRPTRGRARVAGFDVASSPAQVRQRLGLLTEHHGLYTRMRAAEYLVFFGWAYGLSPATLRRRRAA